MTTTKEVPMFQLQHLKEAFGGTAEWRRGKADEYPDDERNQKAAEILDRLAATVNDISPAAINSYRDFFAGRDPNDPLEASETEQEHLRDVGFHSEPQNAEEFLRDLVDELRKIGEPRFRIIDQ
jgi:hypothetical protein